MKIVDGQPMHLNKILLICTFCVCAALMWNVQVNRYRVSTSGVIFDSIEFAIYDPRLKVWVALEK